MMSLETAHLKLRRFRGDDAQHLFELDSDPQVMRYLSGGAATPMEIIQQRVLPAFLSLDEEYPTLGAWAAEERHSGHFVGWFTLRPVDHTHATLILGFRLCRPAWGRGYATEGVRAIVDRAFGDPDVRLIVGTTYEENIASRRVMEKVGLTLVRTFRLTADDLAHVDTWEATRADAWDGNDAEYALDRDRWERLRTGPG